MRKRREDILPVGEHGRWGESCPRLVLVLLWP